MFRFIFCHVPATFLCFFRVYIYTVIIIHNFYVIARQWPNRLELMCVRTSTKSFSDLDLIWYVGRPRPHMRTSVTSTQSKVKVKVTVLPNLQKLHFSRSVSSAVLACSSKLMVDADSMGPGLQRVGARFFNFLIGKLSRVFKLRPMSIFQEIQMAIFRYGMMLQSHGWTCW